jgi:ankyrin repeat protein
LCQKASKKGHIDIVKKLLAELTNSKINLKRLFYNPNYDDVDIKDIYGRTALMHGMFYQK